MNGIYFNPATLGFIPESWTIDGTYDGAPAGAVLLTEAEREQFHKVSPPDGKMLGAIKGRPGWVDLPPVSCAQVLAMRQAAYKLRSDPIKIEAEYDALISGGLPDYSAWRAEVEAIEAELPKPSVEQ